MKLNSEKKNILTHFSNAVKVEIT